MKSINSILVDAMPPQAEVTLQPAMEAFVDLAVLTDARISLEDIVKRMETAQGNLVDVLIADQEYKGWLADSEVDTPGMRSTGAALLEDAKATMEALFNPSMEADLIQQVKRTYAAVMTNLKTFGKGLFEIKNKLNQKKDMIESHPILLDSVETYRFLSRDGKQVSKMATCLDDDDKFITACEAHFKKLFETSTDMSKRFRSATTSKSVETIREAIDHFDESLVDRQSFDDLTKFKLLGNRVVELDKRGYPKFTAQKAADIKFSSGEKDENNLVSQIAAEKIQGFSIGGEPKGIKGIQGFNMIEGKQKFTAALKKSGGSVPMADFMKVIDRAQQLNQDSVKFAQMAATMSEKVARMTDDLNDAYDELVDKETGEHDKVLHRELLDLHKSARRSVSQYMFLGKIVATMMEDHASFVYRNVTVMANHVLKNAKEVAPSPFEKAGK